MGLRQFEKVFSVVSLEEVLSIVLIFSILSDFPVIKPLKERNIPIKAFIDDIYILADSHEENIKNLKEVLKVFSDNNIKLRLDKCAFLKESISHLGRRVNGDGIKLSLEHIDKLISVAVIGKVNWLFYIRSEIRLL